MLPIQQLLERFKNLTNTEKAKKQLILEIIKKRGIPIELHQIQILKNTLFIRTNPIIKTEILLKKEQLLKEIQETNGILNILNIQ